MSDATRIEGTMDDASPQHDPVNSLSDSKPEPPRQLDRRQILDATEACLREVGYDKTTIRKIADRLDCAVGSIYRYFKDKRDLLTGVTQRRFESVGEHAELGTPIDRAASLYYRLALEQPELYQLMFWLTSVGQPAGRSLQPKVVGRIIEGWTNQLGSEAKARQLWASLHAGLALGLPIEEALASASTTRRDEAPVESAAPVTAAVDGQAAPPATAEAVSASRDDLTLL